MTLLRLLQRFSALAIGYSLVVSENCSLYVNANNIKGTGIIIDVTFDEEGKYGLKGFALSKLFTTSITKYICILLEA